MALIKSEFSCPICKKTTGALHQIYANLGELSCSFNPAHKWNDYIEFQNLGPTMDFKPEKQKALPQQNHTPLTISVPIPLKAKLDEVYGDKMAATVVSVLNQMSEGQAMMIPETDVVRLTDRLGKRPVNSGELIGLVYAKTCEADDAKSERDTAVKDLKAYEGMAIGRIVIDLGDQLATAQAKAQDAEQPLKYWAEKQFRNALESGWF